MADKQVRIRLSETGAEQTAAALGRVDGALKGLAGQAIAVGAAYFGAAGIINGLTASVRAAGEAERAQARLDTALGRHSKALEAYARARMKATTFDDDATISAMALIATNVKSEKQIKRLTAAAQDLAAKLGMDLDSAAQLINKTIGAEGAGALARYGVHLDESKNKIDAVVEALAKYAGGQAEAAAATDAGKLQQLANAWGNVGEMIGGPVTKALVWLGQSTEQWLGQIAAGTRMMGSLLPGGGGMPGLNEDELPTGPERGAWRAKAAEHEKEFAAQLEARTKAEALANEAAKEAARLRWAAIEADVQQIRIAEEVNARRAEGFRLLDDIASLEGESLYDIEALAEAQTAWNEAEDVWLSNMDRRVEAIGQEVEMTMQLRQAKLALASATLGSLAQINQAFKGSFLLTKRAMQAQAVVDTFAAANRNLATYPLPLGAILAAAAVVQGLANVATIQSQGFASGGYITGHGGTRSDSVPAMLSRGEGVLNAATVARIGGESAIHALNAGKGMSGGVTIQFNGPITDREYVRDFLVPEIRKAVSRA